MNKFSKVRAVVVSVLLAAAVGVPALSVFLNAPKAQAHVVESSFEPTPVYFDDAPISAPARVTDGEPTVTEQAAPVAKPVKKAVAAKPTVCRVRTLEQGGSPDAPAVVSCDR